MVEPTIQSSATDLKTEDPHAQKDKRFHAEIAKIYDYVTVEPRQYPNELLFRPIDKRLKGGRLMLDLGCGTGQMFLRYAHLADRIIAVDHSREMLAVAAEKAKAAGLSKVNFIEQDVSEFLSLNQNLKADLITCVGVLHHLEPDQLQALLAQIATLLAPGGQIVIAEPVYSSKVPAMVSERNQKSILIKRLAECMPPGAVDPDEAPLHEEAAHQGHLRAVSGGDVIAVLLEK